MWAVIRCMSGVVKGRRVVVLEEGGVTATRDEQKASMCVRSFRKCTVG